MLARIVLALFLVGALLESARGIPRHQREPPPKQEDNDEALNDDDLLNDMILKPKRFLKNSKNPREKRMAFSNEYKWPKVGSTVEIPYEMSGVEEDVVERAVEVFKAKTCIRFVPRGSQENYVQFSSGSSCYAPTGMQDIGRHTVSLSSGCASKKGKVMHEMMHVMGFMHEQCRPDRDDYVTINYNNIKTGFEANFDEQDEYVDLNIPYDCDSILHYKGTMASRNGEATITSTHCSALGNGDTRLSLLDYKRVNALYSCDNPTYTYFTVRVQTDDSWGSGTDCYVYLTLHGESLTSTEFELDLDDADSSNLFEAGSDDTFSKMAYRNDLGSITGISIRMVSNGYGEGWWPTLITVTDPVNNEEKTFTNDQWLSPSDTYGQGEFTLST